MRCTDLNGHRRILQVAGYAASNKLVRKDQGNDGVTLTETVERMVKLGEIEEIVPSQSSEARVAARHRIALQRSSKTSSLSGRRPCRVSRVSRISRTLRYGISRRDIFERFLTDGRIERFAKLLRRMDPAATLARTNSWRVRC